MCKCEPKCRICGWGMHDAAHGPTLEDQQAGGEIWRGGHLFEPKIDKRRREWKRC